MHCLIIPITLSFDDSKFYVIITSLLLDLTMDSGKRNLTDKTKDTAMCELDELSEHLFHLSADGAECAQQWERLTKASRAAVGRIPFELWLQGFKDFPRIILPGHSPHLTTDWRHFHFHKVGAYGIHEVYLGVDGALYSLDSKNYVEQELSLRDFSYVKVVELANHLEDYFKSSDAAEALYVAIEHELARVSRAPRPKSLGTRYNRQVIVDLPMPGHKCIRLYDKADYVTFSERVYVQQLPECNRMYYVDEHGRLIKHSNKHHRFAVAHIRSILTLKDAHRLLLALHSAV